MEFPAHSAMLATIQQAKIEMAQHKDTGVAKAEPCVPAPLRDSLHWRSTIWVISLIFIAAAVATLGVITFLGMRARQNTVVVQNQAEAPIDLKSSVTTPI